MIEKKIDVIVVGASAAGMACAKYLVDAGQVVLLLEASQRIGQGTNGKTEKLRQSIESRGGEILTNVAVIKLRPGLSGRGFHIKTKFNYIHAHHVVLAINPANAKHLLQMPRWHKAGLYQIYQSDSNPARNSAHGRQTAKAVLRDKQAASSSLAKSTVWSNKYLSKWPAPHQQLHKQSHQ